MDLQYRWLIPYLSATVGRFHSTFYSGKGSTVYPGKVGLQRLPQECLFGTFTPEMFSSVILYTFYITCYTGKVLLYLLPREGATVPSTPGRLHCTFYPGKAPLYLRRTILRHERMTHQSATRDPSVTTLVSA